MSYAEAATGILSEGEIAPTTRLILRRQANVTLIGAGISVMWPRTRGLSLGESAALTTPQTNQPVLESDT
jgi:hypothetical protein